MYVLKSLSPWRSYVTISKWLPSTVSSSKIQGLQYCLTTNYLIVKLWVFCLHKRERRKDSKNFSMIVPTSFQWWSRCVWLTVLSLEMEWLIDFFFGVRLLVDRLTPRRGWFIVTFREPVFKYLILFALIVWKRIHERKQRAAPHEGYFIVISIAWSKRLSTDRQKSNTDDEA